MQIVIDMSEEEYNRIIKGNWIGNPLAKIIEHGTPLPEKHGRIADMDEAIKCIEEVTGNDATYAISLIEWACGKRTILEAREDGKT